MYVYLYLCIYNQAYLGFGELGLEPQHLVLQRLHRLGTCHHSTTADKKGIRR